MDNTSSESFKNFLNEIKKQAKTNLVMQAMVIKNEKELIKENEKDLKQLDKTLKEILRYIIGIDKKISLDTGGILNALSKEQSVNEKSKEDKSFDDLNKTMKSLPKQIGEQLSKLSSFKVEEKEKTFTENLKEAIAAHRQIGDVISKGAGSVGKGISSVFKTGKSLFTNPVEFKSRIGAVGNTVKDIAKKAKEYVVDIEGVEGNYSVEQDRYAKEYARRAQEDPNETRTLKEIIQEGKTKYTEQISREKDIEKVESNIKQQERMGFKVTNPESDNINTSSEIISDSSKKIVDLQQNSNEILNEQLKELKNISANISPKIPSELPETKAKSTLEKKDEEPSGSLGTSLADLAPIGKKAGSVAAGLGSKLVKFATGTGGKLLGSVAALGMGAYTAYSGYKGAEDQKQQELQDIEEKIKAGELTPEQGEQLKKEVAAKATENKGGALGEGGGMAAGAIGGAMAGAKLGSFFGPAGVAVGGLAGGVIGGISGSSVGKNIGGAIGKGIAGIKGLFGMEDIKTDPTSATKPGITSKENFEYVGPNGKILGRVEDGKYFINGEQVDEKTYRDMKKVVNSEMKSRSPEEIFNSVQPKSADTSSLVRGSPSTKGGDLTKSSVENTEMVRENNKQSNNVTPIVSNNVNTVNTTSYTPMKGTPRTDAGGSALESYIRRVSVYQ